MLGLIDLCSILLEIWAPCTFKTVMCMCFNLPNPIPTTYFGYNGQKRKLFQLKKIQQIQHKIHTTLFMFRHKVSYSIQLNIITQMALSNADFSLFKILNNLRENYSLYHYTISMSSWHLCSCLYCLENQKIIYKFQKFHQYLLCLRKSPTFFMICQDDSQLTLVVLLNEQ